MAFLNMFSKEKEQPTAITANDRLSLVLSYQRSDIDEKKIKLFQQRLVQLCHDFGYDVVGKIEVIPQSCERTTIINASIPVKLKGSI
jgi:cell division topological specificity factor